MMMQGEDISLAGASPKAWGDVDVQQPYTGIVLIHGIGDIKRNATLEEAVNALVSWFNHQAGLSFRADGAGRIWLAAHLTDDPSPDAPAASASLDVVPPESLKAEVPGDEALRLVFREVWWAESFGLPSLSATIRWSRVQFRDQAANLLLLFGAGRGRSQRDGHTIASANSSASASSARVQTPSGPAEMSRGTSWHAGGVHMSLTPIRRVLLSAFLRLYALVQYVWKALQWTILAPSVFLLLLLLGFLRLLALIPPFRTSVVAGISRALNYVMLHWISEVEVYTLNYTRAAGIRERFEREVRDYLRDSRCQRVVVIAHSMGTVIAYEGLTAALSQPDLRDNKPVTFICLASALRRAWLMTAADPSRLRRALSDRVRWLHFWARYDPVAAGPLGPHSVPRLDDTADPTAADLSARLSSRLADCQNVAVVNTDSTFTDHTTYWRNMEQVVAPIARELVAGHPALEHLVETHLPTRDDVLWRRWRIAWRSMTALTVGLMAGAALELINIGAHLHIGAAIFAFLSSRTFLNAAVVALTNGACNLTGCFYSYHPPAANLFAFLQMVLANGIQVAAYLPVLIIDPLLSATAALSLTGIVTIGVGKLIAEPSPPVYRRPSEGRDIGRRRVFGWAAVCSTAIITSLIVPAVLPEAFTESGLGNWLQFVLHAIYSPLILLSIVIWLSGLVNALRRRRWAWVVGMVLVTLPFVPLTEQSLRLGAFVGITGCAVDLFWLGWRRRWRDLATSAALISPLLIFDVVALIPLLGGVVVNGFQLDQAAFVVLISVSFCWGPLIYGLWSHGQGTGAT